MDAQRICDPLYKEHPQLIASDRASGAVAVDTPRTAGLSPPYASGNNSIAITIASSRPMFAG
jgi:hypothetical protein